MSENISIGWRLGFELHPKQSPQRNILGASQHKHKQQE
jgi:hypothetical protein